jgi:hypothetical protein
MPDAVIAGRQEPKRQATFGWPAVNGCEAPHDVLIARA